MGESTTRIMKRRSWIQALHRLENRLEQRGLFPQVMPRSFSTNREQSLCFEDFVGS